MHINQRFLATSKHKLQFLGRITVLRVYTVFQKNWTTKLMAVTLSNLDRFSKFFIVRLSDKCAVK